MRVMTTGIAFAASVSLAIAAEPAKYPAVLAGHAMLPAATKIAPADAPEDLKLSGRFTAPDGRRVDRIGAIEGTSFLSTKEAPRKTGFRIPFDGQPVQGFSASRV